MPGRVVIERDVLVPMRDGTRLAADIYRPEDNARHPVLVQRIPYNKSSLSYVGGLIFSPIEAAERGYVVVVQDTRGRFNSEGHWRPFFDEANDGYDTVEWAAQQPWSNGNVGVYGSSYMGVTALQAAVAAPPHLKAVLAYLTGSNYHEGWTYSGGAFELGFNFWWAGYFCWNALSRLSDAATKRQAAQELVQLHSQQERFIRHLPLKEIGVFEKLAPYWREWLDHPTYDEYWQAIDVARRARATRAPVLHVTGWYDNFLKGHLALAEALQSHPDAEIRANHRFIVGPWDHEAYMTTRLSAAGERDFGPSAIGGAPMMAPIAFQWFDRWLKGELTPIANAAPVRYFVMGDDTWQESSSWPPPHTPVRYYLHSAGRANSRFGDGVLTTDSPAGAEPPDSYVYDPNDPVPSVGGRTLHPNFGLGGVADQSRVEERGDVLVYTSAHLTRPLTIAGPVTVTLYVASSAPDTDFTAKLVDVQPDGYCANIAEGILRARYRNGPDREELLEPGKVYELTIDLWAVAHTFRPGHRIRLEVSSSNFPRFDRNLNNVVRPGEGGPADVRTATQWVLHDAERPSHVTFPLVS